MQSLPGKKQCCARSQLRASLVRAGALAGIQHKVVCLAASPRRRKLIPKTASKDLDSNSPVRAESLLECSNPENEGSGAPVHYPQLLGSSAVIQDRWLSNTL